MRRCQLGRSHVLRPKQSSPDDYTQPSSQVNKQRTCEAQNKLFASPSAHEPPQTSPFPSSKKEKEALNHVPSKHQPSPLHEILHPLSTMPSFTTAHPSTTLTRLLRAPSDTPLQRGAESQLYSRAVVDESYASGLTLLVFAAVVFTGAGSVLLLWAAKRLGRTGIPERDRKED